MNYYRQHQSDFLEGLKAFLRIPSISTLSEHKPDIRRDEKFHLPNFYRGIESVAKYLEMLGAY